MTYLLVFTLQSVALLDLLRRLNLASAAVLLTSYIFMIQLFYISRSISFSEHSFPAGSYGSFYHRTEMGVLIYAFIFALVYAATFGVRQDKGLNIEALRTRSLRQVTLISYSVLTLSILLRIASIDLDVLWWNNTYLLLNSFEVLTWDTPITRLNRIVFGLGSIVVAALAGYHFTTGRQLYAVSGFVLILPALVFGIARSSRSASLSLFALFIVLLIFGKKRSHKIAALSVFALIGICFITALYGRGQGSYGLSTIFQQFSWMASIEDIPVLRYTVGSVSQGIFVTSDSLYIDAYFTERYKLLSFSPFPSSIDGFNKILRTDQVRLHDFVPMSAIGEIYHFGLFYMAFFCGFMMLIIRQNASLSVAKKPMIFLLTSIIITMFFIIAQTYPLRNVFRQFFIVFLLLNYGPIWRPIRRVLASASQRAYNP